RFLDVDGNPSNLSPVSDALQAGTVTHHDAPTDAQGNPIIAPVQPTLPPGIFVQSASTGFSPGQPELGYFEFKGAKSLTISNLDGPTEAPGHVTRRQILRNTSGQTLVFYVEVDTTDLAATSFTLTKVDGDLAAGEAVPLYDTQGNSL